MYEYSSEKDFYKSAQEIFISFKKQIPVDVTRSLNKFNITKNTALCINTSGSTGAPKTFLHSFDSLENATISSLKTIESITHNRSSLNSFVCCLPVNHVAGLAVLHKAISKDANLAIVHPKDYKTIHKTVYSSNCCISLVNSQIFEIAKLNSSSTPSESTLLLGGSRISEDILNKASRLFKTVIKTYGMTETFGGIAYQNASPQENRQTKTVINDNTKISFDNKNHIVIESNAIAPNYLKGKAIRKTNQIVTTTDIGEMKNGSLIVHGRSDFAITSSGKKYFPEEIETKLHHFFHHKFVVTSIKDEKRGNLIVILSEGSAQENPQLGKLPNFISSIKLIDNIPLLPNGKVDRLKAKQIVENKI